MKKSVIILSAVFVLILSTFLFSDSYNEAYCQDCSKYLGKGYCVDYIKQRVGRRPGGNAGTWKPNIEAKKVQSGDVAIFSSPSPYGHVAIVERVIYERNTDKPYQIDISEWNWGATMVDRSCAVTNMFGKTGRRTVRVNTVKGYWRP